MSISRPISWRLFRLPIIGCRVVMAPMFVVSMTLLGAAVFLAGCATGGAGSAVAGSSSPGESSPLVGAARAIGVATTEPEPADFVRASRPATAPDFIPVGVTPPARAEPKRDAAAVEKLERELDGQRARSRAYSARPRPASGYDGKIPPRPTRPPQELTPQ